MIHRFRALALAAFALLATGCTQSYKPDEPYFISDVNVTRSSPTIGSPGLPTSVESRIEDQLSAQPRAGAPKRLSVDITEFRTKNPAAALLVGDVNAMAANVTITGSNGPEYQERVRVVSDAFAQGVIGAVIAAARTQSGVERQLAASLADKIARLANGGVKPERPRIRRGVPSSPPSSASTPSRGVAVGV